IPAAPPATTGIALDDVTRAIPAAPPATTGIALDDVTRAALEAGREVTLRASGFGAGERDIFAVVYSTPTVLERELVADADGVVSWTGVLPASLANGEHTFTFQGSVARGIQFTLERDAAAAIGSCVVTEASLSWGFMTTFRNYIEGIGGGGWALEGVEYRYPSYVWPTGTGSIDPGNGAGLVDFGGVIRFTGHDGALDTTLANTRIELVGETGYLVIDVSGTTQSGSAVDAAAVRFATFAVPEGAWDAETGVLTLSDVPTSLTADGAAAFGSYPAGTALDPLSATIAVNAECLAPEDEVLEVAVTSAEAPEAVADAGAPVWPWVAGGIALLVIIAGAWVFAVRRRAGAVRE
ncbi:MAG: HtaA domain-containing protein, partial [Microthrixaceae bacterium]|nr:HtaA domain-containing protein [Microthrixaceae bacterium]